MILTEDSTSLVSYLGAEPKSILKLFFQKKCIIRQKIASIQIIFIDNDQKCEIFVRINIQVK